MYLKHYGIEIINSPRILEKKSWIKWILKQNLSPEKTPWIINCGWLSTSDGDYRHHEANNYWVDYTEWIAEATLQIGGNLLSVGSCLELVPENQETYTNAKRESLKKIERSIPNGQWTWIRPYYIYSRTEPRPRVLNLAKASSISDGKLCLNNPDSKHDFISISDVVNGIWEVLINNLSGEIEIGSGFLTPVRQLILSQYPDLLIQKSGTANTKQNQENISQANNIKLMITGWRPNYTQRDLRNLDVH
jgi:hypothetical protein